MPDVGGLIPIRDLAGGADPTPAPTPSGARALLVNAEEPEIVGSEPPVTPDLVTEGSRITPRVRRVRLVCGHLRSSAVGTRGRATYVLAWTGLDVNELALLRDYFIETVGGRLRGFPCRVDGPDEAAVNLRLQEPFRYTNADRGVFTMALAAEELLTP